MSERTGTCNFCAGTGVRWFNIPNSPQKVTKVETTDEERKEMAGLRSGAEGAQVIEVIRRMFVRPCAMCEGTAGYSGDAMDGHTL